MQEEQHSYLFTSESVTEGHPDKICDQISDAILDAILAKETELAAGGYVAPGGIPANPKEVRCAVETMATTGLIMVTGEVRTQAYVDVPGIAREVLREIGYDRAKYGFDCDTCGVLNTIHEQSPDIAQGVDESWETQNGEAVDPYDQIGAGDQGMMFGYACNETKTLMPLPHYLASRLAERLSKVRKDGIMSNLRPDGKTQVSVRYVNGVPTQVEKVVISTQHSEETDPTELRKALKRNVIDPVFEAEGVTVADDLELYVNPTGRFVVGGPMGDAGLTGRKIIVDTYGGMGRHGGGAFSGKDSSKVDRSAAYAARHIAKNLVAAGVADQILVELSYAIGIAQPLSIYVDTYNSPRPAALAGMTDGEIARRIGKLFDLRPAAIVKRFGLKNPIFEATASYGHFGNRPYTKVEKVWENGVETEREIEFFGWEKLDAVEQIKREFGL